METGMKISKRSVRARSHARSGLLVLLGGVVACDAGPQGRFVRVDQSVEVLDARPEASTYELTHPAFAECPYDGWELVSDVNPDTGEPEERSVASETRVVLSVYDTLTHDAYTFDAATIDALSRTLTGEDTTRCGRDGEPPTAPMLCDEIADGSTILSDEEYAALCEPWWLECYAAMRDLERSSNRERPESEGSDEAESSESREPFTPGLWVNDGRLIAPPTDEIREQCSCTSSGSDIRAAHDAMLDSYDWDGFYDLYYGDSTLTFVNDAPVWGPVGDDHNENANSGICGAWLFSDEAFKELEATGPDEETSLLQDFCGGVSVLDIASDEELMVQPLTSMWLGRNNSDRNLRLKGNGDLVNAWVLAGRNDSSRICPTCKPGRGDEEDSCAVATGAAQLVFSDDLRYRAAQGGSSVHLLMAECAPRVDSAELGWQQACWHVEMSLDDIGPKSHLRVKVGGFGPDVARDVTVLDSL